MYDSMREKLSNGQMQEMKDVLRTVIDILEANSLNIPELPTVAANPPEIAPVDPTQVGQPFQNNPAPIVAPPIPIVSGSVTVTDADGNVVPDSPVNPAV